MMGNVKRAVSTIFGATFEHYFGFGALFKHLLGIFGSTFLAFWEHNLERPIRLRLIKGSSLLLLLYMVLEILYYMLLRSTDPCPIC